MKQIITWNKTISLDCLAKKETIYIIRLSALVKNGLAALAQKRAGKFGTRIQVHFYIVINFQNEYETFIIKLESYSFENYFRDMVITF